MNGSKAHLWTVAGAAGVLVVLLVLNFLLVDRERVAQLRGNSGAQPGEQTAVGAVEPAEPGIIPEDEGPPEEYWNGDDEGEAVGSDGESTGVPEAASAAVPPASAPPQPSAAQAEVAVAPGRGAVPQPTVAATAPDAAAADKAESDRTGVEKAIERPRSESTAAGEGVELPRCEEGMCIVPAGEARLGCSPGSSDCLDVDFPETTVSLPGFWIDRQTVTVGEYGECVKAGVCTPLHFDDKQCLVPKKTRFGQGVLPTGFRQAHLPAVCVDWFQAVAYCQWREKRLPSEAEWEKAARGTDGRIYPWGSQVANCGLASMVDADGRKGCGALQTEPGCKYPAGNSIYGVCDLAGGVWEWVFDAWVAKGTMGPDGRAVGSSDPTQRTMKGGSWTRTAPDLRSSMRDFAASKVPGCGVGFRCARQD